MTSGSPEVGEPFLKRPFDFLLALVALCMSWPFWPVLSVAIYLRGGGAVFFTRERCGRGGRRFTHIKFRTMRPPEGGQSGHKVVYVKDAPGVTRIGRLL